MQRDTERCWEMLGGARRCWEVLGQGGTCPEVPQPVAEAAAGGERWALPVVPSARLPRGAPEMPKHLEQNGVQKGRAKLPPRNKNEETLIPFLQSHIKGFLVLLAGERPSLSPSLFSAPPETDSRVFPRPL